MTITEARSIIEALPLARTRAARWMDLGCGSGTFTRALAELLPPESTIVAVDRDRSAMNGLPGSHAGTQLQLHVADMERFPVDGPLDGVLMANALHYVADQRGFLRRILPLIVVTGTFLLVEYDTDRAREPWVPFPLSASSARTLLAEVGFNHPLALGERRSVYGADRLYAMAFTRT